MLLLSRKCADQLRIPEENITLNVIEISGQRVRLGMVPPAGQPFDLRDDEETTDKVVPEVQFTERGYQVLVWASQGAGLRINERVQVRVVSLEPDSVLLGVVAPPARGRGDAPDCPGRNDPADAPEREGGLSVAEVSSETLADWIARKITAHLKGRPRGGVQELARAVGVSPVSINRWRKRHTNVASDHLDRLLAALGVSLEDLAADLGVRKVVVPDVRARGPAPR